MNNITLELIQDKATNFVMYDNSQRGYYPNLYIRLNDIYRIQVKFKSTSEFLSEDKIFILDYSQKAIHEGQHTIDLTRTAAWTVLHPETLILQVLGSNVLTLVLDTAQTTNAGVVTYLNTIVFENTTVLYGTHTKLSELIEVYLVGDRLCIRTIDAGATEYIKLLGGTAMITFGWLQGIYWGNTLPLGTTSSDGIFTLQSQMQYTIHIDDFGEVWSEIPAGYWYVEWTVYWKQYENHGGTMMYVIQQPIVFSYTECTYKQFELYEARLYEWESRQHFKYREVQQGYASDEEIWIRKMLTFSGVLRALRQTIEIDSISRYQKLRDYLNSFIGANILPNE